MAQNIIHDSSWASLWVKEYDAGTDGGALPAVGALVKVGAIVGVVLDTPILGPDLHYWTTVDTACVVKLTVAGTGTAGQTVYWSGTAATLTVGTNTPIGYLHQAKAATGDDLFLQLVPGAALPIAVAP